MPNAATAEPSRAAVTTPGSHPAPSRAHTRLLRGVAASSGIAAGPCRVIRDAEPGSPPAVRLGEILVVRSFPPDWSPLLPRLGGLITELGGQLSGAAILAREFCTPAVVQVPAATAVLQTGEWVTVNGQAGTVRAAPDDFLTLRA